MGYESRIYLVNTHDNLLDLLNNYDKKYATCYAMFDLGKTGGGLCECFAKRSEYFIYVGAEELPNVDSYGDEIKQGDPLQVAKRLEELAEKWTIDWYNIVANCIRETVKNSEEKFVILHEGY